MTVATFAQPNYTSQDPATYKGCIDASVSALARVADNFAPHQSTTPAMNVRLDAGHLFDGSTLTEVAAQTTATITAPVANPRIDRVVVDSLTGVVSVVTGTAAASPVAPAIPGGKVPVARVLLQTSSTTVTNSMITDERDLAMLGSPDPYTAWTAYTPTVTAQAGTLTTVSATGKYKKIGKTCFVEIDASITTNGTGATGINITLPFTAAAARFSLSGRESAVTGKGLAITIAASGATAAVYNYDNTYPGGSGNQLVLSGVYETA